MANVKIIDLPVSGGAHLDDAYEVHQSAHGTVQQSLQQVADLLLGPSSPLDAYFHKITMTGTFGSEIEMQSADMLDVGNIYCYSGQRLVGFDGTIGDGSQDGHFNQLLLEDGLMVNGTVDLNGHNLQSSSQVILDGNTGAFSCFGDFYLGDNVLYKGSDNTSAQIVQNDGTIGDGSQNGSFSELHSNSGVFLGGDYIYAGLDNTSAVIYDAVNTTIGDGSQIFNLAGGVRTVEGNIFYPHTVAGNLVWTTSP